MVIQLKLIGELRNTNIPENEFSSDILVDEVENENFLDLKNEESENQTDEVEQGEIEEVEEDENQGVKAVPTGISTPVKIGGGNLIISGKKRYFFIATFLAGLAFIVYLNMSQKDCMQWVEDHYEKIEKSEEGFCNTYYDARYFNLKKIKVCDTTQFFDDHGRAKVWYIRIGNSVECYNQFAPYPENTQRFLKPITQHMIDKYLSKRPKCD